jgi:hypothetical protein
MRPTRLTWAFILLYFAKRFSPSHHSLMELHIRVVSRTYPDGVRALKDVRVRARAERGVPRASKGGFECSD